MNALPLTNFIIALLATPVDRLVRADPARLAEKYGINIDWVRAWLDVRRGQS